MSRRIIRGKTVCFTGHRSEKLPRGDALGHLGIKLSEEIEKVIHDGYNTFMFGGSSGWDLMAAKEVIKKRTVIDFSNPRYIKLIAVIPFEEQAVRYSPSDHELYYEIMPRCDEVITLCTHYKKQCYAWRDKYMVERSSRIICYWNGQTGSATAQAVRMAERERLAITNLYKRQEGIT